MLLRKDVQVRKRELTNVVGYVIYDSIRMLRTPGSLSNCISSLRAHSSRKHCPTWLVSSCIVRRKATIAGFFDLRNTSISASSRRRSLLPTMLIKLSRYTVSGIGVEEDGGRGRAGSKEGRHGQL